MIEGSGELFANATISEPQMIEVDGREGVSAGFELTNGVKVVNRYVSIDDRSVACISAILTDELYEERGELFDAVFDSIEIS